MTDRRSGLARFRAWLRRRGSPGRPARYPAVAATVRTFPIPADSAGEVVVAAALRGMITEWVELLGRDRHEDALASIITEIPMASGMAEAVGARAWTPDILRQVIATCGVHDTDAEPGRRYRVVPLDADLRSTFAARLTIVFGRNRPDDADDLGEVRAALPIDTGHGDPISELTALFRLRAVDERTMALMLGFVGAP